MDKRTGKCTFLVDLFSRKGSNSAACVSRGFHGMGDLISRGKRQYGVIVSARGYSIPESLRFEEERHVMVRVLCLIDI